MVPTNIMGTKALSTYYTQKACCRPHYKVPQNMLFTDKIVAKIHCAYSTEELCCWSYHESRHTYTEKKGLQQFSLDFIVQNIITWGGFLDTALHALVYGFWPELFHMWDRHSDQGLDVTPSRGAYILVSLQTPCHIFHRKIHHQWPVCVHQQNLNEMTVQLLLWNWFGLHYFK